MSARDEGARVSEATVRRLSGYLRVLDEMGAGGRDTVSSEDLAARCGTTSAQIRKDFSVFGSFGRRGIGYPVGELGERIRRILGLDRSWKMLLVGAGSLGRALLNYREFRRQDFRFHAIFDADPEKQGQVWDELSIQPMEELGSTVRERGLHLAVLAVPAESAQRVADRLVEAGIRGVLNFAPAKLKLPDHVTIRDVNLAVELEGLSYQLNRKR